MNKLLIFLCITTVLSACSGRGGIGGDEPGVSPYQAKWHAAKVHDYDLSYEKQCYCLAKHMRPILAKIRDGEITEAVYADDNSVIAEGEITIESVESLFAFIADASERAAHSISVSYDLTLGFPVSIAVDYHNRIADDGIAYGNIKVVKK